MLLCVLWAVTALSSGAATLPPRGSQRSVEDAHLATMLLCCVCFHDMAHYLHDTCSLVDTFLHAPGPPAPAVYPSFLQALPIVSV